MEGGEEARWIAYIMSCTVYMYELPENEHFVNEWWELSNNREKQTSTTHVHVYMTAGTHTCIYTVHTCICTCMYVLVDLKAKVALQILYCGKLQESTCTCTYAY